MISLAGGYDSHLTDKRRSEFQWLVLTYAVRERTRNWTYLDHILKHSLSTQWCFHTILMLIHILNFIFVISYLFTTYIVALDLLVSEIPEYLMLWQMKKTFLSSKDNLLQQTSFLELGFTTCFFRLALLSELWTTWHITDSLYSAGCY